MKKKRPTKVLMTPVKIGTKEYYSKPPVELLREVESHPTDATRGDHSGTNTWR